MKSLIVAMIMIAALAAPASALRNPSSIYCEAMGYKYTVEHTPEGDWGYCQADDKKVEAWGYLLGKEAPEKSYCAKEGYELKVVDDPVKCAEFGLTTCSVCVLKDGREVEVTKLMNLTFAESECGDGTCGYPENYETCPKDCKTGSVDDLCDGAKDGICDPDCLLQGKAKNDADCESMTTTTAAASPTTTAAKQTTTTVNAAPPRQTTLPPTKPLEQQKDTGCVPFLLAPIALIFTLVSSKPWI
ncbi:MAG: DUF333 domain-containing protein [Candidatus Altiarchaeota archaeon]